MSLIDEFKNAFNSFAEYADSIDEVTSALTELNDANTRLNAGLSKQYGLNQSISTQYVELSKKITFLEQRNAALAKAFGINRNAAAELSTQFAKLSQELQIGDSLLQRYAVNIKKMLPTLNQTTNTDNKRYQGLIQVNRALTTQLGLTEQQAEEFTMYATQTGKDARTITAAAFQMADALDGVSDDKDSMGYFKMITTDIADAGAEIQLQFGKIPGQLEMAALKGRALGVSLQQMEITGKNLLNIEQSIGQELEYQLLSGHRLVDASGKSLTNTYREAMLTGNMNKQADTLLTILENEGDVLENNLFARQQMSQLLNIDEKTLSRSLQKKKLLDSIPAAKQLFELEGEGLAAQAQAMLDSQEITKDQFASIMKFADTRTTDEILKEQLEIARDGLAFDILQTKQLEIISKASEKTLSKDTMRELQQSFIDLAEKDLKTVGGVSFGLGAADAIKEIIKNSMGAEGKAENETLIPQQDVIIPANPSMGPVISSNAGTFQLHPQDSIIAGTELFGNNTGNGSTDIAQFAAMIVAAIREQTSTLNTTMRSDPTFGRGLNDGYYS